MSNKQLTLFDSPLLTIDPLGTVLLILQRTRFGIERKVNLNSVEVKADKALLSLNAKIMDSPEMKTLIGLDGGISRDISRLALPSIFKFGAYVVPVSLVGTIEAKLQDYKERRDVLAAAVIGRCEQRIEEAKVALGDLSKDITWPAEEAIRFSFSLRWRFVTIGLPDSLRTVAPEVFEAERLKVIEDLQASKQVIEEALITGFQEFNVWLVERLTPDPERKRKKSIQAASLKRFREFLTLLPTRNVTGMDNVELLASRARTLLEGVEASDLVKNESLADAVRSQFTTLQGDLGAFVEERSRSITFEEAEDETESVSSKRGDETVGA